MDQQELSMETMEQVTGGVYRTINTGIDGMNAAIRADARKDSRQIASLPNGTVIDTVTDNLIYDPVAKRNFVQITFTKNGKTMTGWVAASIVGLPR